jgi:hypothetical protein
MQDLIFIFMFFLPTVELAVVWKECILTYTKEYFNAVYNMFKRVA